MIARVAKRGSVLERGGQYPRLNLLLGHPSEQDTYELGVVDVSLKP